MLANKHCTRAAGCHGQLAAHEFTGVNKSPVAPDMAFLTHPVERLVLPQASRYLLHRSDFWRRKGATFRFKMLNNIFYYLAQITVDLEGIITVDARDEVWAFSKVGLILFAPLHPLVIFIARLHFSLERR